MHMQFGFRWVVILIVCASSTWVYSDTPETTTNRAVTPRILLVGDSWSFLLGLLSTFETVLANEGLSSVSVVKLGIGGSTAAQWAANHNGKLDAITTQLTNNPTIDIVHINLGGNDLIPQFPFATQQDLINALESIAANIDIVVDHIHSINPNIRIALGSYDYVAFAFFNPALLTSVPISVAHAAAKARFEFINATGYTHYSLGFPGQFEAFTTPIPGGFPEYTPAGGGDPSLPTHSSHNDGGIHLLQVSYIPYIERCFNEFYRPWLLEDVGGPVIWVDFAHRGDELGTLATPMNDLTNAATMVNPGGTIKIKGNTTDNSTPETLTLNKALRIEAVNGPVIIGGAAARRNVTVKTGFVSQPPR